MSLYNLPDELLLIIFNYCNAHNLIQLSGVCQRFYHIASELLIKESYNLLVTGQMSEKFRERCQPLLSSYKDKFYIHNNWKRGRYESKIFYPEFFIIDPDEYDEAYRSRLQMTKDVILLASDMKSTYKLCAFNRTKNGSVSDDNVIVAKCDTQIMDIFVPCNDIIVTNHSDGSIRQWTIESLDGRKYFNEKLLHSSRPNFIIDCYMDVTPQSIVIGFDMNEIELWKYIPEENSIMNKYIPDLNLNPTLEPRPGFITFDSTGTKFAAEFSYTCNTIQDDSRFIIYDINKCYTEMHTQMKDLDFNYLPVCVYQILWKEPNDILYLNNEKIIKMDVRTHKVVQKWNASLESKHYDYSCDYERFTCMSTDNQYAIMTGTSFGKLILWDRRKSDFIQMYDKDDKDDVGHVNCLHFDSSHMYVAAENGMFEFDFTKL